jgi:hypothetical protein
MFLNPVHFASREFGRARGLIAAVLVSGPYAVFVALIWILGDRG